MQDAGVDEVARWLVESVELPQYEQAFRDNKVDGDMLLELVARDLLGELVDSRLHQCRLSSQLAKFERCARAGGAADSPEGAGASEGDGGIVRGPGTRHADEAALPDNERPRQRARRAEPAAAPLVAVESPVHGVLVYARPPLADLEVRAVVCLPQPIGAQPHTSCPPFTTQLR